MKIFDARGTNALNDVRWTFFENISPDNIACVYTGNLKPNFLSKIQHCDWNENRARENISNNFYNFFDETHIWTQIWTEQQWHVCTRNYRWNHTRLDKIERMTVRKISIVKSSNFHRQISQKEIANHEERSKKFWLKILTRI